MANYPIEDIEGIGPEYGKKLREAGINDTDAYLEACLTPKGRKALAEKTGISDKLVLKWANMTDLYRIKGVGSEFAELLEAAGVDTVKELKHRNADNLAVKMAEVNEAKKLTRRVPDADALADWIKQAESLPAKLEY